MLICGPPAYGAVPPARTSVPATLMAFVAIGVPAGVVSRSTVRAEVGVTSGDGPTPARDPERLQTAVAHAALAPPAATVTRPEITPSWSTSAGPAACSARPVLLVYLQERARPARTSYSDRPSAGVPGA
jgi:hypothetical protein